MSTRCDAVPMEQQQPSELSGWEYETRPGGWIRAEGQDGLVAYLRFALTAGGERFDLKEAVIQAPGSEVLSGRTWRRLPISEVEGLLNVAVMQATAQPAVPLTEAATKALAAFTSESPTDALVSLQQYFDDTEATGLTFRELGDPSEVTGVWMKTKDGPPTELSYAGRSKAAAPTEPPQISPPARLTDDFLKTVAEAYRWYTTEGKAPAPAIAENAGVPTRRVHRWVSDARKRGFLPPARPGRAG